jgi:signal transduction histidine kinase
MTVPSTDEAHLGEKPPRTRRGTGSAHGPRALAAELVDPRKSVIGATESVSGLCRYVLMLRLAATLMLVVAAALIDPEPARLALGTLIAAVVTAVELTVLTRRPSSVTRGWVFVLVELAAGGAIVAVMQGGPVYFSFSCGSAAVLGVVLGLRAGWVWVLQTVAGYLVVAWVIQAGEVPSSLAVYLTGVPTLYVLVGLAAATTRTAVLRHVTLARTALEAIERSAVAAERGRMARELHDSVEKTLRGLSFAASALPASVRRRPDLVDELAATVADGARTAADEARQLLGALRSDDLEAGLDEAVEALVGAWSAQTGIPASAETCPVEVAMPVRHELLRITREALGNVARHSGANRVWVVLEAEPTGLQLVIQDDGAGFGVPADLADLAKAGHYGLVGMSERAERVGGRLRVWSDPQTGTQVVIRAPRITDSSLKDMSSTKRVIQQ